MVCGDAANYASTFEQAPRLLNDHGVIVFTDVLAMDAPDSNGGILNPADRSNKAQAMRNLLDEVQSDERFRTALIPVGTGLLLAAKQ